MTRESILKSVGYWTANIQIQLYDLINTYIREKKITKTTFAQELGVSKGYVTQVLNGDFDHKISKFVELSLASNKIPMITFVDLDTYIKNDLAQYPTIEFEHSKETEAIAKYQEIRPLYPIKSIQRKSSSRVTVSAKYQLVSRTQHARANQRAGSPASVPVKKHQFHGGGTQRKSSAAFVSFSEKQQ